MKKTERFNLYQEVTDKIVSEMEKGVESWQKSWGTTMPRNLSSQRDYRGINTLLLWFEQNDKGYATGDWLTFKQAKGMGGNIKKGEHGNRIVFFSKIDKEVENRKGESEIRQVLMAKYSTVFNLAQIEKLDQKKVQEAQREHQNAQALLDDSGATFIGGQPSYSPKEDVIRMPEAASFNTLNDYYATALHELSHWTGSEKRLDRSFDDSKSWGDEAYAAEELVAELSSAFMTAQCGIQGRIQHAEYLNNWLNVLKNDDKAIFRAASKAREASEYINELSFERCKEQEKSQEAEMEM